MSALSMEEVEAALRAGSSWRLSDGKLVRDWKFGSFAEAVVFVNRVAAMAEAADHHPDFDIRYDRVKLALVSHDAGGITKRDLKMAAALDREFPA